MALRLPRPQGPRIGLTVTDELNEILERIASATGTGKASFIREWLISAQPQLKQLAISLELASQGNIDAFDTMTKLFGDMRQQQDNMELDLQRTKRRAAPRFKKKKKQTAT